LFINNLSPIEKFTTDQTLDRTLTSTQETFENCDDLVRKKTEEDYAKFTDEAKKSLAALKMVITCRDNIVKWALDSMYDGK